jgi:hypothetical protein
MRHPLRNVSLLVIAVVVGLCTASSASAANVVANPSFEEACGAPTNACYWGELDSGDFHVNRDTSVANTGSASYRFAYSGNSLFVGIGSGCFPTPLSGGSATLGFSYRVPAGSTVNLVQVDVTVRSGTTCQGFVGSGASQATAIADGAWHDVTNTLNITAGQSFTLGLGYRCNPACGTPPVEVHFDDLAFDAAQPPTAARLSLIQARRVRAAILLRWRTTTETDTLGFNVYRQQRGKLVKLNRTLIFAVFGGTASGHAYSWLDRGAPREAARYRLQAVSLSGVRSWVGPTVVAR